MKIFLKNLVLCLLPILLIFIVIEVIAEGIPNSYRYKRQWLDKNGSTISTLILGNSHPLNAINPLLMDSSFNIANSAQSLVFDEFLLHLASEKCPHLRNVVLSLDYMTLSQQKETEDHRLVYYTLYMGYGNRSRFSRYDYELYTNKSCLLKIKSYLQTKGTEKGEIPCDTLGNSNHNQFSRENLSQSYLNDMIPRWHSVDVDSVVSYNFPILKRIAAYCKDNHYRLILVHTPFYHLLNDQLSAHRVAKLDSIACLLHDEYSVEYYDFRTDSNFVNNDSLFNNCDHLSDIGAVKFTERINEILRFMP